MTQSPSISVGAALQEAGFGYSGNFQLVSQANALTATASGTQATSAVVNAQINRFTHVASPKDGCKLPPSVPGMTIFITNSHASNSIQVFGTSPDTINDVATATGVTQMAGSALAYTCAVAGKWYVHDIGTGYSGSLPTFSTADGLTALSGGASAGATPITTSVARFSTVVGATCSALLPVSVAGMELTVINAGTSSINVFPAGIELINTAGSGGSFSVAANKTAVFYCATAGQWHTVLSN